MSRPIDLRYMLVCLLALLFCNPSIRNTSWSIWKFGQSCAVPRISVCSPLNPGLTVERGGRCGVVYVVLVLGVRFRHFATTSQRPSPGPRRRSLLPICLGPGVARLSCKLHNLEAPKNSFVHSTGLGLLLGPCRVTRLGSISERSIQIRQRGKTPELVRGVFIGARRTMYVLLSTIEYATWTAEMEALFSSSFPQKRKPLRLCFTTSIQAFRQLAPSLIQGFFGEPHYCVRVLCSGPNSKHRW